MVRIAVITATLFLGVVKGFSQTAGDYRTTGAASSAWTSLATWQFYNGSTWVSATSIPDGTAGRITILSGKTVTSAPNLTIQGILEINSTAVLTIANSVNNATAADFTIAGTLTNNGSLSFIAGTSAANPTRLQIDGSMTNAGTINMIANHTRVVVNGTLTNSGFVAITSSSAIVTVNGRFLNSSTNITSSSAKLTFESGSTYEHLFTTTDGRIPAASWNLNSTCLISGYTTNTTYPGGLIGTNFGNFTWNTPSSTATSVNLSGQLTSVLGTLSILSTGSSALYLGQSDSEPVTLAIGGDLIISGTSNVHIAQDALGNSVTVGGSIQHSSSSPFYASSGSGSTDITLSGDLSTSSTFNAGIGTLTFQGAGAAQSISGAVNAGNIMVINDAGVNVEGIVNLTGSITLSGSTDVFDADGTNNSGTLTLLSTADNPAVDATIAAIPSGATFQGNVTVQRYMSGEGYRMYRYISSPVTSATVASWQDDFSITGAFAGYSTRDPSNNSTIVCGYRLGTSASMFTYNEATQAYAAYPTTSSSAALVPGVGYSALVRNCSSPTIIDVRGPINQGEITPTITYTTSGSNSAMYGYNLIGNPYPSALDWETAPWTMSNISSVMAISDNSTGSLVYQYFDNTDGSADDFIAVGQAFWVRATAASPSLTFTEDIKAAPGSSYSFFRKASPVLDRLTITVTNGSITDKAFVKVNPAAKSSLDNFDGPKMDNSLFDISTLSSENIPMAINAVEEITCGSAVKINLKDFTAGSYKLNFQGAGLVQEYEMVLTDKYTGSVTNVTVSPDYIFVVDNNAASKAADRFELTFKEKAMSLSLSVDSNVALCATESGKVKLYNPQANVSYFATLRGETVSDTLAGGASFIEFNIPAESLAEGENTVYINAVGNCDNIEQLEQSALVQKYSTATITQVNGRTLQSNYSTGNQWYLNGQLLSDTSAVLRVGEEGEYQLSVTTGSCTLSATYALGAETFMDKIAGYPNPVESIFSIELPIEQCSAAELPIMNDVGRQVGILKLKDYGTYRTGQYDFSSTPSGLYLIRIESGTGVRHMKVLKK
ncbi:T9SS type A sorting domain-containing protein [Ohtaekwangia kribbensis]|uniref:T9SS type A sorting domain-containing protein n=1 Tax=Ohtaekwangia kribbensis TaxID=688913 RepID=A0ABW3K585_9BACT